MQAAVLHQTAGLTRSTAVIEHEETTGGAQPIPLIMHDPSVRVSSPQQQRMCMPHPLHQCGAETCLRRILWGGLGTAILEGFQEAVCHCFAVHRGCRDACF